MKKSGKKNSLTLKELKESFVQYMRAKESSKVDDKIVKKQKPTLMEGLSKWGKQTDEKHYVVSFDGVGNLIKEVRVSVVLNEERARELLAKKNLLNGCLTPSIDPDKVKSMSMLGFLSEEEYKSLLDEKRTEAIKYKFAEA